jgi:hypothetical protein
MKGWLLLDHAVGLSMWMFRCCLGYFLHKKEKSSLPGGGCSSLSTKTKPMASDAGLVSTKPSGLSPYRVRRLIPFEVFIKQNDAREWLTIKNLVLRTVVSPSTLCSLTCKMIGMPSSSSRV